jgi:hypothetical protein
MSVRSRRALPGALILLSLAVPATAAAVPVTVNLRVEGPTRTVFDGPVTTDGHDVVTATAGSHKCDGTNGGAEPAPGPTATAALDDAARLAGFTIDGPYGNFGIDDYFIERVADQQIDPSSAFWSLWINHAFSDKGGCQKRVLAGQDVLWAGVPFSVSVPLKLEGPGNGIVGQPLAVRVIDGQTGSPQAGATVAGATTGADGRATVSFAQEGIYRVKAEKPDTIRSNTIVLCVDPPGAQPCSSTDTSGPALSAGTPAGPGGRLASNRGRSRTMLITWAGDDQTGSGVSHYKAEVSELSDGAGASQGLGTWRTLIERTTVNGAHFRGEAGDAYAFRITATDRALNETTVTTDPVIVPVDDRNQRLVKFSKRNWKRMRARSAWGGTVVRASRAGATARLRFRGTSLSLVGRKLPKGGRLRATIDGRRTTIRLRGRTRHRSVVWTSRRLEPGAHRLVLRTLGGGPVELDAVAPLP